MTTTSETITMDHAALMELLARAAELGGSNAAHENAFVRIGIAYDLIRGLGDEE